VPAEPDDTRVDAELNADVAPGPVEPETPDAVRPSSDEDGAVLGISGTVPAASASAPLASVGTVPAAAVADTGVLASTGARLTTLLGIALLALIAGVIAVRRGRPRTAD
jgi:hypothetical protein